MESLTEGNFDTGEVQGTLSWMAARRAPTPFFVFSEEQRGPTRAECLEKTDAAGKVTVATVAKAIGEKWRALSDEEKAVYKEKAQAALQAEAQAHPADEGFGPRQCTSRVYDARPRLFKPKSVCQHF